MATFDDLLAPVTASALWTTLTARFDAAKVAWRSWGTRNPFLVVSQFAKDAAFQSNEAIRQVFKGQWLDYAKDAGTAFVLFAKSQYQLDPQPAVFARGRVVIRLSSGVGPVSIVASQLHAGTPGPVTTESKLLTSLAADTLLPGENNVVEFLADQTGDSYNLPVGAPFELKTSVPGADISIPASGDPTLLGVGAAALVFFAADSGVSVEILNPGAPSQNLTVTGNLGTKRVTISLPTDGASLLYADASVVRKAVADAINVGALAVGPLLLACKLGGNGTGIVQPTAASVSLGWKGTWLSVYGRLVQDNGSLAEDCANRWDTLGGGSGDGVTVSDAQTDSALAYWAKRPPAGYQSSPVAYVRVYSNIDASGNVDGAAVLVVLAGQGGALPGADVTAAAGNFESPQKYSFGTTLRCKTVTNTPIFVIGVVYVRKSSGKTANAVKSDIEAAFVAYTNSRGAELIGYKAEQSVMIGIIWSADPVAIDRVEWTGFVAPIQLTFDQFAVFDLAGLVVLEI